MADQATRSHKKTITPGAWQEARALIYAHRGRLAVGLALMLVNRLMTGAEGIRNLVGRGLVQLVGGLITAAIALGVLFYLNWRLTLISILILGCFGGGMAYAFAKLRPLFRDRGKLNAEVTGRLGETLGGIRIVKAYRAERSERLVFTRGANTLFRNIATTMTGISGVGAFATVIIGAIGILMILEGGHAILSGQMTLGDFFMYGVFIGLVALPLINIASIGTQITEAFAGLDRIREIRRLVTEDAADGARASCSRTTSCSTAPSRRTSRSPGRTRPATISRRRRASPTATSSCAASRRVTTPSWGSEASSFRAASASGSRSHGRSSPIRGS